MKFGDREEGEDRVRKMIDQRGEYIYIHVFNLCLVFYTFFVELYTSSMTETTLESG